MIHLFFFPIFRTGPEKVTRIPEEFQGTTIPEQIACCNEIIRLLATITKEECLGQC